MRHENGSRLVRRAARALAALAAVAMLATAVASCDDDAPTGPREQEVLLGGLFALTGERATFGRADQAAMELAIEDVNLQLRGNTAGLRFAAAIEDTPFEPAVALAKAQALRARGVQVVIGPQTSAEVVSVKPFAQSSGMLVVSPSSTAGSLAVAGDNVFRFAPADSLEGVAITALMWDDGVRAIVPVWRDDPGNADLAIATVARFRARGGAATAGVEYAATTQDFSATTATLRAQLAQAIAQHGTAGVAVYVASFQEVAQLFVGAAADPVLASVRWYGSNGGAHVESLLSNAQAAAFAVRTGFPNPLFGLEEGNREVWEPLAERIRARTSLEPRAYSLAVYDAVWVAAKTYIAVGAAPGIEELKAAFVATAKTHFGSTGWTLLNVAGDRGIANYDFWAVREVAGVPRWTRVARYDVRTGTLTR